MRRFPRWLTRCLHGAELGCLVLAVGGGCTTSVGVPGRPTAAEPGARWKVPFDGSASSPVIVGDTLYAGSRDGAVYALDAKTGATKWRFQTGEGLTSGPEIVTVPRGAGRSEMMAAFFDSQSKPPRGKREVDATPVVANGTVFVGSKDFSFYAIDATTGERKWSFRTEGEISHRAVVHGGSVIFASADGFLYAVDATTGRKKWAIETLAELREKEKQAPDQALTFLRGKETGAPGAPIVSDGVAYVTAVPSGRTGTPKIHLYAIDVATGTEKWTLAVYGYEASRLTTAHGRLYFSTQCVLYAVDTASGKVDREFRARGGVSGYPTQAIIVRDMLICGSDRGLFAADLETGVSRWSRTDEAVSSNSGSHPDWEQSLQWDDRQLYVSTVTRSASDGTPPGTLRVLDPATGNERWSFASDGGVVKIAAIEGDAIYVTADKRLRALHTGTGKTLWSFKMDTREEALPLISGGAVFLPTASMTYVGKRPDQGHFYAIDTGATYGAPR